MPKLGNVNRSDKTVATRQRISDLTAVGKTLILAGRIIAVFLAKSMGLLVASAKTSRADDALSNSIRGGVMNHRTGKFDEGNDPAGWYERD